MSFILSKLMAWAWPLVAGAYVVLILIALGLHHSLTVSKAETVEVKRAWAADRAQAAEVAASQAIANQAETARRIAEQKEATDEAERNLTQARADATLAGASAERLQQRVAALVAQARAAAANPASAASSPPAPDALDLLADLQRKLDDRSGRLAFIADQARVAGQACESAYDALTK